MLGCERGSASAPVAEWGLPVAYDLVEQIDAARCEPVVRRVATIDVGSDEARRQLLDGFARNEIDDSEDIDFAWGVGRSSKVSFISPESGPPAELVIRCNPFRYAGAPRQTIRFELNGRNIGSSDLKAVWQTCRIDVPAGILRQGRNTLRMSYAYYRGATPSGGPKVQDGDRRKLAVAFDSIEVNVIGRRTEAVRDGLEIPYGGSAEFYIPVPEDSTLTFDHVERVGRTRGKLIVSQNAGDGKTRVDEIEVGEPAEVPLLANKPWLTRVAIQAVPNREVSHVREGLRVARPAVRSTGEVDATVSDRRPHVFIYLVDTLRADRLGCYGYTRGTSPRLDELAAEGVVFERALAQSPWTRSSVASLMTGLSPWSHGTVNRQHAVAESESTLAEILRQFGYRTGAVITNGNVSQNFGFDQGYESFEYLSESPNRRHAHRLSDDVNERAFAWLDRVAPRGSRPDAPLFLYLHTTDPHGPYTPEEPFRSRFAPRVDDERIGTKQWLSTKEARSPKTIDAISDLYDAEIAFNDHHFGEFLDELRARDLYENSVIVFVSDHGEEFLEHGAIQHGKTLYGEVVDVPLVMKFPRDERIPPGRLATPVEQTDLMPTLLDLIGIQATGYDGTSVLPWLREGRPIEAERTVYTHLDLDRYAAESVTEYPYKLVRWLRGHDEAVELYDLSRDRREAVDRSAELPEVVARLEALLDEKRRSKRPGAGASEVSTEGALRERLKALGYLQD